MNENKKTTNDKADILIVEDSAIQAEMLRRLLSQEGYTVTIAKNGREGLAIAQQQKLSLILSDINMPEMDGYQMCYKIKQDERLRDVPVLLLTELTDPGDVIRGLIAGADNYITKPFNEKLLLSMLDAMLSSARVPKKEKTLVQLEVTLEGERQVITIDSERVLNLLLSTYKNTVLQNKAIIETQEKLREINKQLEDKFIEIAISENRFKTLVQTIPDIVYRIDNNGNFVYVNHAVRHLGYEPQELMGRHFSEIILPTDVSNVSGSLILPKYKGIATGEKNAPKLFDERRTGERKTKNLEVRLMSKGVSKPKPGMIEVIGEEVIPVEINSAGLYATNAKAEPTSFIGTVGVIRDITERRMAEESRNQLVAIIQATPDIVVTANTVEGNILFMNEAGYRVLGIQKDEDVSHLHLQDILPRSVRTSVLEKGIPTAIREGYWNDECLLLSRSGRTIQVLLVIIAHKKADGTVSHLSTIARDITELKQYEEKLLDMNAELERRVAERTAALTLEIKEHKRVESELNKTENKLHKLNEELEQRVIERTAQIEAVNRRLEATNKELESFSYSVSHDLRAPLRAIDGFSRMLVEDFAGKIDAEGQRLLNVIRSNAQKMGQLIDDLLSFSRMGRHEMVSTKIDMTGLARSVFEDLKSAAPERIIQFSLKTLAPARGDLSMIRQVLVNLISNAIKFTRPRETAVIEVGSRAEGDKNVYYVKDNGVGFDMQYVNKLFGVFQRLHSMEEFEGTGIGLALVQRIILKHGGTVWAEGKVNEGAMFYFTLPGK